jgi:hypothetical protein
MARVSRTRVAFLSKFQRDFLIEHIDRQVPIIRAEHGARAKTANALIAAGMLRLVPTGARFPQGTKLTDVGREAVCIILGEYADALSRAGIFSGDDALAAVRNIVAAMIG